MTLKIRCIRALLLALIVISTVCGCTPQADQQDNSAGSPATKPAATSPTTKPAAATAPATKPAAVASSPAPLPARAMLSLEKIEPKIEKPTNKPYDKPLPPQAVKAVEEAKKLISDKNIANGINELERASGFDPENPTIRKSLGLAYYSLPNIGKAEQNLAQSAKYLPDDVELQLILGQIANTHKQTDKAMLALRTAIQCSDASAANPKAAMAMLTLSQLLEKEGYLTACQQCLATLAEWITKHGADYSSEPTLVELSTNPEKLMVARGGILLRLNQPAAAAKLLENAYRRKKSDVAALTLLIKAMIENKDFDDARKIVVAAAADAETQNAAVALAAKLSVASGQKDMPLKIWNDSTAKKTQSLPLAKALAKACADMNAMPEATALAKKIAADMPDNPGVGTILGSIYAQTGNYQPMLESLADAVMGKQFNKTTFAATIDSLSGDIKPGSVAKLAEMADADKTDKSYAMHYVAGMLAKSAGKVDVAEDQFEKSYKANKKFLAAYDDRLDLALNIGDRTLVEKIFSQMNSLELTAAEKSYIEGRIEFEKGKFDAAIEMLKTALEKDENNSAATHYLARSYLEAGKPKDAVTLLATAISQNAATPEMYRLLFDYYMKSPNGVDSALSMLKTYAERQPTSLEPRLMLLEYYVRKNQNDKADQLLTQIKSTFADNLNVKLAEKQIAVAKFDGLMPKSDYDVFAAQLAEIISKHPASTKAVMMLGELQFTHQNYADAAETYSKVVGKTIREYSALLRYAVSLMKAGKYQAAADFAEKNFKGDDKRIGRQIAYQAMLKGKLYDELLKKTQEWKDDESDENLAEMWEFRWLIVLSKMKKNDEMLSYADSTENLDMLFSLFDILLSDKNMETSRKVIDKIEKIIADQGESNRRLYDIRLDYSKILQLVGEDRIPKAIEEVDTKLEKWPEEDWERYNVNPIDAFFSAMVSANKIEQAATTIEKWVKDIKADKVKEKDDLTTKMEICLMADVRIKSMIGKDKDAIAIIDRLLKIAPDNIDLFELKGTCLKNMGKMSDAIKVLEKAYKLESTNIGLNNDLGYFYIEAGMNPDKAERMILYALKESARQRGQIPDAYSDTYAWILYKKGQFGKAAGIFRDITEKWEDPAKSSYYAVMLDHAGDTLYRLGWKEKAIEAWKLSAEGLKNDTSLSSDDRELKPLLEEKLKAIKDGKDPQLAKTIAELQVEKKTSPSSSPTSEPANKNESDIEVPASSSEDDE